MKCPSCDEKISWTKIFIFTNWYTKRLIGDCPCCGVKLILVKLPLRALNVAAFLLLLGLVIGKFLSFEIIGGKVSVALVSAVLGSSVLLFLVTQQELKIAKLPSLGK